MLAGIIGCVVPVLPGPPLSYAGLLLLHFTRFGHFSISFLLIFAGIAILVTVLDYIVPILGTKKYGGSKAGVWGSTIGLLAGMFFFPPLGIIIGPFTGAFVFEMLRGAGASKSFRSAWGSFVGFLFATGFKLMASLAMAFYFVKAVF